MKKGDLLKLNDTLTELKDIPHTKLAYAIIKNLRILKKEVNDLKAINKDKPKHPKFAEFEKKRLELCQNHSKKDENGKPIIVNNMYEMKNKEEFDKLYEELKVEYKEIFDEDDKRRKEFTDKLKEEVDIELYKIKEENLPDSLTANQLEQLEDIID